LCLERCHEKCSTLADCSTAYGSYSGVLRRPALVSHVAAPEGRAASLRSADSMIVARRGLGATTAPTPQVQAIANAIANAEGGLTPGTAPYRTNNPCDIFAGGSTAGYATMDAGWAACYGQVNAILTDTSTAGYESDMPITQIADIYVCGGPVCSNPSDNPTAWANNVAAALGISAEEPLTDVTGGTVAQTSVIASTGLPASTDTGFDWSTLFGGSDDTSSGGLALTDDSGNLTSLGWGAIVAVVGLGIWAIAS
jgi:hypothetical protein